MLYVRVWCVHVCVYCVCTCETQRLVSVSSVILHLVCVCVVLYICMGLCVVNMLVHAGTHVHIYAGFMLTCLHRETKGRASLPRSVALRGIPLRESL